MKVGSLVELVDDNWQSINPGEIFPVKGKIYTIRAFEVDDAILLEEIINITERLVTDSGMEIIGEIAFYIRRFRELQPPMKISIERFMKVEV